MAEMTPERLDLLAETDPLRLRDEAIALLAGVKQAERERDEAYTAHEDARAEVEAERHTSNGLRVEVERLRVLESGERKAWANAGAERDRAVQDATDAQAALQGAHADAEAAAGNAAYWRRQADRLRLAWTSARRGRTEERQRAAVARREGLRDRLAADGAIARIDQLAGERNAAEADVDQVHGELAEERLTSDALRKNRDQLADELRAAREELVRVGREADELRGGWQAADRDRKRLREQRDKANNRARDSRAELEKAREQIEFVRSFAERIARSGNTSYAYAGQVLLDIVGPVTVAPGTPPAMQACPHRDFDDPTRCLICHP
jgi:chromosome segregation ATPase